MAVCGAFQLASACGAACCVCCGQLTRQPRCRPGGPIAHRDVVDAACDSSPCGECSTLVPDL